MKIYSEAEALHKAAAYCSLAERCEDDVRKKLTTWGIEPDAQVRIIKRLTSENFLNEDRFCQAFIKDKTSLQKWGERKVTFELQKKKIPESVISHYLKTIDKNENRERLLDLILKKKKTVKGKNDYDIEQKLMRYAASKGYSSSDIYWAIETIKK